MKYLASLPPFFLSYHYKILTQTTVNYSVFRFFTTFPSVVLLRVIVHLPASIHLPPFVVLIYVSVAMCQLICQFRRVFQQ